MPRDCCRSVCEPAATTRQTASRGRCSGEGKKGRAGYLFHHPAIYSPKSSCTHFHDEKVYLVCRGNIQTGPRRRCWMNRLRSIKLSLAVVSAKVVRVLATHAPNYGATTHVQRVELLASQLQVLLAFTFTAVMRLTADETESKRHWTLGQLLT